jgi:hypothetical protein
VNALDAVRAWARRGNLPITPAVSTLTKFAPFRPDPTLRTRRKQKTLDKLYTYLILFLMLAEQITFQAIRPTELTPFPTHCSALFVAAKKTNSFGIRQIRPLSTKHPGGYLHGAQARTSVACPSIFMPCVFIMLRVAFFPNPFLS